jgi:hypothetical protein
VRGRRGEGVLDDGGLLGAVFLAGADEVVAPFVGAFGVWR